MTRIRQGDRIWQIHDEEWPRWVRLGWVPPDAYVLSRRWTKGVWRQADSLEVYHLFRPSDQILETPPAPDDEKKVPRHGPFGMFRGPGVSVTEALILANVIIAAVLMWQWGDDYSKNLWAYSGGLKETFDNGGFQVLFIPLFLHASLSHLVGNMFTFFAAGAVIEEFWGRLRMFAIYIGSGLTGAVFSLIRDKDVLSVGASGAIMGMYGAGLVFLLRERNHFNARQRFKLRRVQIPFFILMVFPAILHADAFAHFGGFVGGVALALLIPPLPERLPRPGHLPKSPDEGENGARAGSTIGSELGAELKSAPATASGPGFANTVPAPVRPEPDWILPAPEARIVPFPQKPRLDPPPARGETASSEPESPDRGPAGRSDG